MGRNLGCNSTTEVNVMSILYNFRYFLYEKKECLLSVAPVRRLFLLASYSQYLYRCHVKKDSYSALSSLLRYERDITALVGGKYVNDKVKKRIVSFLEDNTVNENHQNDILESYVASQEALTFKKMFKEFGTEYHLRMKYPRKIDDPARQGDLMILKPYIGSEEKGVLFIQYDEGVKKFAALFDIERLAEDYRFVVEPSTSGYQNAMFFLCYGLVTDVIFEAQYEPDYHYINSIGNNFHPVRLGAGDWADPALFTDGNETEKKYDVVMVANWLKWKRHRLFFETLSALRPRINKVAVIGYPLDNRTLKSIKKECEACGVTDLVDFYEQIPMVEVRDILQQSKVGILLSKEEGANRSIYECFFSNIPVVLTSLNRGVNRDHVNKSTGIVVSDEALPETLINLVENFQEYQPREWAIQNTGYKNSTRKLNDLLRSLAEKNKEQWSRDIFLKHNSPHARYANPDDQCIADEAVQHLQQYLR